MYKVVFVFVVVLLAYEIRSKGSNLHTMQCIVSAIVLLTIRLNDNCEVCRGLHPARAWHLYVA